MGLSACTLLTKLDGLSGGTTGAGPDGGDSSAAPPIDAQIDARAANEGGADAGGSADADAALACGHPGPTEGLLAYYPFEEGSGTVVHDCSGNHVDGTFVRMAGDTWTTGAKGGGLRVQAPNGCVDLGVPASLQPPTMSVTAWVNVSTYPVPPASGYVIGQTLNADGSGWRIGSLTVDAGMLGWQHATGGTKYPVVIPGPAPASWHHLVVTFAPNASVAIFLDGTLATSLAGVPPITFSAVSMRIGCRADDANYFDGLVDEVRVYDRVLTAAEITALAAP